jgi:hypothetical protein
VVETVSCSDQIYGGLDGVDTDRFHPSLGRRTAKKPIRGPFKMRIHRTVKRSKEVNVLIEDEKGANLAGSRNFFVPGHE